MRQGRGKRLANCEALCCHLCGVLTWPHHPHLHDPALGHPSVCLGAFGQRIQTVSAPSPTVFCDTLEVWGMLFSHGTISSSPSLMIVAPSGGALSPQPHLPGGSFSPRPAKPDFGPTDSRPGCLNLQGWPQIPFVKYCLCPSN